MKASKEHDQPSLAVKCCNWAVGSSKSYSGGLFFSAKTSIGHYITLANVDVIRSRSDQVSASDTQSSCYNYSFSQPKQQVSGVLISSLPPSSKAGSSSRPITLNTKVINPYKKSESQMFVLRNISGEVSTPSQLKEEILKQFGPELVANDLDFPIGYTKGGNKVWIRTASDVQDVWSFVRGTTAVTLWCHGISTNVGRIVAARVTVIVMIPEKTQEKEKEEVCI